MARSPVTGKGSAATRRRIGAALLVLAAALLWALAATPGRADQTVTVNTASDAPNAGQCSLRLAIAYASGTPESACGPASPSGTITIAVPAGTYEIAAGGTLTLAGSQPVVINGAGAGSTVIDAAGQRQVLSVGSGAHVTVAAVTIENGQAPTPVLMAGGTENGDPGGGIANAGTLALSGVIISGNASGTGLVGCASLMCPPPAGATGGSGGDGGGIYNTGTLTITGSTITDNSTGAGAAGITGASPMNADGLPGGAGGAGGSGAGIWSSGTLTITTSTISGNATGAGGAGAIGGAGAANHSGGAGGAGGAGGGGGGIESTGTLTITGSTISGNGAAPGGNGAFGGASGGGVGTSSGANGNGGSGGHGGGVDSSATLSVANSTITGNTTTGGGSAGGVGGSTGAAGTGGAVNQSTSAATLTAVTVAANTSGGDGGGLEVAGGGALAVANSIVAGNHGAPNGNCGGAVTDQSGNVAFGDGSCTGFANGDPKLGALAANGGPTQTMALLAGSAAIDAVPRSECALASDQRGVSRPQGSACDAGAYELAPPTLSGIAASASSDTTATIAASVDPNLRDATVVVDYGTTTTYGASTASQDVGAGNSAAPFGATLTGLAAATTYHFVVVATNGDGTTTSSDGAFVTPAPVSAAVESAPTQGPMLLLTIVCAGGAVGNPCSGPIALTSHVSTSGASPVAVAASIRDSGTGSAKLVVTNLVTVAASSYAAVTGEHYTLVIPLNATGQKLLGRFYKLPATLTIGGTTAITQAVTFSYRVIRSPVSVTWAVGRTSSAARALTVSGIPSAGRLTVICRGGGCPFSRRAFSAHHGRVALASAFKHRRLRHGATLELEITAADSVGKVARFTIRRGRQPSLVELCLPPGARTPTRCV